MSSPLLIISLALVGAYTRADDAGPYPAYWPNPTQLEFGKTPVTLSSTFSFELTGSAAASPILTRGATRYEGLVLQGVDTHEEAVAESTLVSCTVAISSTDDPQNEAATLKLGVDESYSLDVTLEPVLACTINAETVWGALHAFETFSQSLVRQQAPSSSSDTIQVAVGAGGGRAEEAVETVAVLPWAPLSVADGARFTHRGLLVDTSRHFLPLAHLQHVVDSLSYSKLNVLHWHTVDAQSFPLAPVSSDAAGLVEGAYNPALTYSMSDVASLAAYAADRGVRLVIEIDVPGHAASWGKGAPSLLADCLDKYSYNINDFALNPTLDETYSVLAQVVGDLSDAVSSAYDNDDDDTNTGSSSSSSGSSDRSSGGSSSSTATLAPPQYTLHLGGDEVVYGCWANDSSIVEWMAANGYGEGDFDALLGYFVSKAQAIAKDQGGQAMRPTQWEEVFKAGLASTVLPETIFQVWTGAEFVSQCTAANFSTIASPSEYWYLDIANNTWEVMYDYDPSVGLTIAQQALLLGGEVAMWGEKVDSSNFDAIVHPRAEAVAERLWSHTAAPTSAATAAQTLGGGEGGENRKASPATTEDDPTILSRLLEHRCRLLQRGVGSSALQPGFCATTWV